MADFDQPMRAAIRAKRALEAARTRQDAANRVVRDAEQALADAERALNAQLDTRRRDLEASDG